MVNKFTAS